MLLVSEHELIRWIRERLLASPQVLVHSGDDLAIVRTGAGERLAFGLDTLVAGVDFRAPGNPDAHAPEAVGRKALAVNLSDLAAMGARPLACVASVVLPQSIGCDYPKRLYEGMSCEAAAWNMPIVGGDISAAQHELSITVAVLGDFEAADTPLLRSAARPGDLVYVTGPLGGSILGRHLTFTPRLQIGRFLAAAGVRVACIDVSDGLSTDAQHIAGESGVRLVIEAAAVPVAEAAHRLAASDGRAAFEHALNDGEDFELLFTLPADAADKVLAGWPHQEAPHQIGRVETGSGVCLEKDGRQQPLPAGGYEHQF